MSEPVYKPHDKVPKSGIYVVVHDAVHAESHQVTCIQGRRFPPCRNCGKRARFRLKEEAVHVEHHPLLKTTDNNIKAGTEALLEKRKTEKPRSGLADAYARNLKIKT